MSFRIADSKALLFAALLFGLFATVKAQSVGGGQHILFSSPDGQITSNAPLPMARAPEPQQGPSLPVGEAAASPFASPPPAPMFALPPPPALEDNTHDSENSQNPTDFRKQLGILTPAQIMNVPTAEQIFGLAEKPDDSQKKPGQSPNAQTVATNDFASDATAIIAEPGWARALLGDAGKSEQSSNTTGKASGFFGGFFDTARRDDTFGNHSTGNAGTFGTPQTTAQQSQSPWGSQFTSGQFTPAAPAAHSVANNFTLPGSAGPGFASQSPFTPPQVSTLDTLPKLPALPSVRPQNDTLGQPSIAPSWGPKPPPWTQAQTPAGMPVPLNPALKR